MINNETPSNLISDPKTTETPVVTRQVQRPHTSDESIHRHVRMLMEGDRMGADELFTALNKFYDEQRYSSSERIRCTQMFLNDEGKEWYEQNKAEIKDDWLSFCDRLKQHLQSGRPIRTRPSPPSENVSVHNEDKCTLEDIIHEKFNTYSGIGDAKSWLLQTMNRFKLYHIRRDDQLEAMPLLLVDEAYLWLVENVETIPNFEVFSKLFLAQFALTTASTIGSIKGTVAPATVVPDHSPASHLQRTIADEIIKRPTLFRGSQDDVHDWLEKLEQRFAMAHWNDEDKLRYISIHLQDDAYRWWMQTSTTIKTWSSFTDAVVRAFGSTRAQELAFEQLKWYKQTINQSITQYYEKVIELCKKVDVAMPDSLKLQYLMAGIKESLKTHVALQDPKSTEAFLSSARKVEDIFALKQTDQETVANDTYLNATSYQSQPNQTNFTPTSNNNFHRSNPRYPTAPNNRPMYSRNTSSTYNGNRQNKSSKYTRPTQRSNACFNCGTLGHYARDCTRPHFQ
ncbi:unnamed protein product [Adineta ricciae]|uniref:CCHC-type domain-containing protein n=1 Tax=Adineta ricciae TaxID=249248 RepID=A0A816ANL9_ADIRI|nr:unnamed protein product [Adineta ricciae]